MSYKYITNLTSPNQNARGHKIENITIHYWGSRGQKIANVVDWLCSRRSGVSAHYVVEAGTVYCIVDPDRRAWHAGSSHGNHVSIGIECRPEATDGDYETVAELIRNLRAVYGDLPLIPHKRWTSTDCPGPWDLDRLDRLARGTKAPAASKGTAKPAAKPAAKPVCVKAPAFPLPAGYYYGPPSGPVQSVSGRTRNSRVPGDVIQVKGRWRSKGLAVYQARMQARGWGIGEDGADGRFGRDTERVVRQFQKNKGLKVTGHVDKATWDAAWTLPVK